MYALAPRSYFPPLSPLLLNWDYPFNSTHLFSCHMHVYMLYTHIYNIHRHSHVSQAIFCIWEKVWIHSTLRSSPPPPCSRSLPPHSTPSALISCIFIHTHLVPQMEENICPFLLFFIDSLPNLCYFFAHTTLSLSCSCLYKTMRCIITLFILYYF